MSLSVVVYRKQSSLPKALANFELDPETGQPLIPDALSSSTPESDYIATDIWLGNVASVAEVATHLQSATEARESVILGKVLYSGSHSGDYLTIPEVRKVQSEIDTLLELDAIQSSEATIELLKNLQKACSVALTESNPLVFV